MSKPKHYLLEEAIEIINEPNRTVCKYVLEQEAEIFRTPKGSKTKHQAWPGGYIDHVAETMNLAILLYEFLSSTERPLNFSLSDSLLVMFLHDLEKPFKQIKGIELGLVDSTGEKNSLAIKYFRENLFE